jgi:hypothetical protein
MKIIAYELLHNTDHIPKRFPRGDIERYDASVYPQESLQAWDFITTSEYTGLTPIYFLGWLKRLLKTEFPRNNPGIPLMSERMLEILTRAGDFPYQAVPARIFDYSLQYEIDNYLENQNFSTNSCDSRYMAVKLLEHIDVVDRQRSELEFSVTDPSALPYISHLVMSEPQQGFPPIFRVEGSPTRLFVSIAAKEALDRAGIKGTRFLAYGEDGNVTQVEAA